MSETYEYGPPEPTSVQEQPTLPPPPPPPPEPPAVTLTPQPISLPSSGNEQTPGPSSVEQSRAIACLAPSPLAHSGSYDPALSRSEPIAKSTEVNENGTITLNIPAIGRTVTVQPVDVDLGPNPQEKLDTIMRQKIEDDKGPQDRQVKEYNDTFGKNFQTPTEVSKDMGYFGSDRHRAYGEIASARTGGKIPPEWFMTADPFGGFSGGFPGDMKRAGIQAGIAKLPEEDQKAAKEWLASEPGKEFLKTTWTLNKTDEFLLGNTGIAHDTDMLLKWFGAGTLAPLQGEPFWFNGVGAVPGDPKDDDNGKRIRANFAKAGMPEIPDYLMTDGNAPGWLFEPHDLLASQTPPKARAAADIARLMQEGYGGLISAMARDKTLTFIVDQLNSIGKYASNSSNISWGI